jgi:hypothetical protein
MCAILGYSSAYSSNYILTFRDNLSVPSSKIKKSKKTFDDGTDWLSPASVQNYRSPLQSIPEERISHLFRLCSSFQTPRLAAKILNISETNFRGCYVTCFRRQMYTDLVWPSQVCTLCPQNPHFLAIVLLVVDAD